MQKISKGFLSATYAAVFSTGAIFWTGSAIDGHAQATQSNGWFKACSDQGNNKICNVQFQVVASNGQVVTSVNLAEIEGEIKRRVFQVTVPTGRAIQPGIELKIDDNKGVPLPYSFCTPRICAAEAVLDDRLVGALKAGGEMLLTSTNFQGTKNPIKVTLSGFTAAYDGPPIKREDLADRQKQLSEELKKKAEETQRKLQEAQEQATTGGASN